MHIQFQLLTNFIREGLKKKIKIHEKDTMLTRQRIKWCKPGKVGNLSRGWPKGSLSSSYYTEVLRRVPILSLDCSTLPLPYNAVLSKAASSPIFFLVFGMTRHGIEPQSPRPLANILLISPMAKWIIKNVGLVYFYWFGLGLWHIKLCRLFDAKFCLYRTLCLWFVNTFCK